MLPRMEDSKDDSTVDSKEDTAPTEGDERARNIDTGRVLALSDGVFAIAATLLVLDLKLPDGLTGEQVTDHLHDLIPVAGAYALSYVLIGVLWLAHHRLFRLVARVSGRVAQLNLILLGLISLLPFVTSVLARYGDQRLPTQLYAATITAIFLLEAAVTLAAARAGHLTDPGAAAGLVVRAAIGAVIFAASIGIAAVDQHWAPAAAKYSWLALIPARPLATWATRQVRSGRGSGTG